MASFGISGLGRGSDGEKGKERKERRRKCCDSLTGVIL